MKNYKIVFIKFDEIILIGFVIDIKLMLSPEIALFSSFFLSLRYFVVVSTAEFVRLATKSVQIHLQIKCVIHF